MRKKAVLFDLFFTLIVPDYSENAGENEFSILGIDSAEWRELEIKSYQERALGKIRDPYEMMAFIVKDLHVSDALIEKITEARLKRYKQCLVNIDKDNIIILNELKNRGCKIAAVSNVDIIDIIYWRESEISKYFDCSIFSFDAGVMKPDKKIYTLAIDQLNEDAGNCLFVGDGGFDELKGAKDVGIETVLTTQYIKNFWPEKIEDLKRDADYVIDKMHELLEII